MSKHRPLRSQLLCHPRGMGVSHKDSGVDIVVLDTPILDTTQYKDLLGIVITDIVLAVLSFGAQLEVDTKSSNRQRALPLHT